MIDIFLQGYYMYILDGVTFCRRIILISLVHCYIYNGQSIRIILNCMLLYSIMIIS